MNQRLSQTLVCALALTPLSAASAQLVGVEYDTGRFYSIDTNDGSFELIDDTGLAGIGSIEFNPLDGKVYGFTTGANPMLYQFAISASLDEVTPVAIGPLGVFSFEGGMAYSPAGVAYAVNGGVTVPALLTLNLGSGLASVVSSFSGRHDFAGLGWRSDGVLIGLDSTDNALLAINPANASFSVLEEVGPAIGTVGGMALGSNVGYFVTAGPLATIPGSNSLYSFDLITGEQFFIANYEDQILGSGFSGLTFVPEPATLGLLTIGGLALLRRRNRS
jgi:hypothetical protein